MRQKISAACPSRCVSMCYPACGCLPFIIRKDNMAEFENGSAVLGSNPVNSDTGILNHDCSKMDEHGTSGHMLPSIFDVVKSGMLIPVQTYIENMGVEVLKSRDDQGHTPAHWSCLGGHATILRYIIEMKGPVDQPSENDLGQRPIHWACVNGHIAIVDILLQAGATLDVTDHKGCTPLIVACQYGQTMLSGYLIGKGARTQMKDKDGDTALHWAAFKGHSELLRLLIYSGFNPHQKDNYGQTALHLSCINGNLTSVIELIELEKVEINDEDHNGKTPLMLAAGRKHHMIVTYLNKQTKARASLLPKIDLWTIVFGPPGNHKGPLMFFIVSMLFWAYPMYIFKCLPVTWYELETLHVIFMFFNVIMWIALYHAATTNPGFIPRNIPEYDRAIKQVAHFDEWKQGKNPLSRLCHTCRTVKPMRSKHCRICNRCVRLMDHHCPYIYNCVGENNRVSFVMFTTCSGLSGLITLYFILYMWNIEGTKFYYPFAIIEATFFEGLAVFVALNSVYQMLLNLTTNERSNWHRYKYLQDGKGQYFNAYDRGWKNNILEFLFLKKPLSDDEIEFLNVTVV